MIKNTPTDFKRTELFWRILIKNKELPSLSVKKDIKLVKTPAIINAANKYIVCIL